MQDDHAPPAPDQSPKVDVPRLPISLTRNPDRDNLPQELLAEYEPVGEDLLGEGAFAVVWLLRHRETAELFALKSIEKYPLRIRNMIEQMNREVRIQQNLSHPNILRLVRAYDDDLYVYMLLEYCGKGSLRTLMSQLPNRRFEEPQAAVYFKQIVKGVEWMHRNSCVHRDLKLENMLLTDQEVVKICDFGWSAEMQIEEILKTTCGTMSYWAPEIWENAPQDESVDMWALGCLLYEMLAGHAPFHEREYSKLKEKVLTLEFGYPPWFSNEACHAVHLLLQKQPSRRARSADLISHAWLGHVQDSPSTLHSEASPPHCPPTVGSQRVPIETETLPRQVVISAEPPLSRDASLSDLPAPRRQVVSSAEPPVSREVSLTELLPAKRQVSLSAEAPPKRPAIVLQQPDQQGSYTPSKQIIGTATRRTLGKALSAHASPSNVGMVDRWRAIRQIEPGTPSGSFTRAASGRAASVGPVRNQSPLNCSNRVSPARSMSTGPSRNPPSLRVSQEPLLHPRSAPQVHLSPPARRATVLSDPARTPTNIVPQIGGVLDASLLECTLQLGSAALPPTLPDCAQNRSLLGTRNFDREFIDIGAPTRCNTGPHRPPPLVGHSCNAPVTVGAVSAAGIPTERGRFLQPIGTSTQLLTSTQRLSLVGGPNLVTAKPPVHRGRAATDIMVTTATDPVAALTPTAQVFPHSTSAALLPFGSCTMIAPQQSSISVALFGNSPRSMLCT